MTVIVFGIALKQEKRGLPKKVGYVLVDNQYTTFKNPDSDVVIATRDDTKATRLGRKGTFTYSGRLDKPMKSCRDTLYRHAKRDPHSFSDAYAFKSPIAGHAKSAKKPFTYVLGMNNGDISFVTVNRKGEVEEYSEPGDHFAAGTGKDFALEELEGKDMCEFEEAVENSFFAIRAAIEQCRLCGYGIHGLEMIQKRAKTLNLANLERSSPFDYGEHTLFFR